MCDKLEYVEYCLFTIASDLIVTEVKEEQSRKAYPPILVTLSGIVIYSKEEQPSKALYPMLVTLSPIVTEVNL